MNVLVVGGSGLIGGDIALGLKEQGHQVTIMARKRPVADVLAEFDFLAGDYVHDDVSDGRLQGFDALVFAAAADIRQLPQDGSVTPEDFYRRVNDVAVPRFFAAAKAAGIHRAIYIGTFYPQVAPDRIGPCPYVSSRHHTDEAVRAMTDESFAVISLNAPFVLGHIQGLPVPHIETLANSAQGNLPELPLFAPRGGTNHISSRAIAQAAVNALKRGEPGKAYLLGGENYSWKEYLELWFELAGNPVELPVLDEDHPLFPNVILFAGPGATVHYQPAADELAVLDYERGDIRTVASEILEHAG